MPGSWRGRVRPESLEHLSEQPCCRVSTCQEAGVRPPWFSLSLYADGLEEGAPSESRALGPGQPPLGTAGQRTETTWEVRWATDPATADMQRDATPPCSSSRHALGTPSVYHEDIGCRKEEELLWKG